MSNEPMCCGEPMIHNSFTGEFECAEAYFTLLDDEVISDWSAGRVLLDGATDYHRERHAHWLSSMRPDGWPAA